MSGAAPEPCPEMAQPIHWDSALEDRLRAQYVRCNTAPYINTHVIGQFLDQHLVIPLMTHVREANSDAKIFKNADLLQATLKVISKTNMCDHEMDLYRELKGDKAKIPQEMEDRKQKVYADWGELQGFCAPILAVVDPTLDEDGAEVSAAIQGELERTKRFTKEYLSEHYQVDDEIIEGLYDWAKFRFDCGNYMEARNYLTAYRSLIAEPKKARGFSALWGVFGADILQQDWDQGYNSMEDLKDVIDRSGKDFSEVELLQHRTWLIHWSLFVFFDHSQGMRRFKQGFVELYLTERYLNAVTTNCPHILRYMTVAAIMSKAAGRRATLKELVKIIQVCKYMYTDPITTFVECLYVDFDFDKAQSTLVECAALLDMDFFLKGCKAEFLDYARREMFETYCRIHQCIDINMLADKLSMRPDAAEQWIVELVRDARLDAKIDSEKNHVLMGVKNPNIYQQVIEKTRALTFKSYTLATKIEAQHYYAKRQGGGH